MDEREALRAAIWADPEEDTPRLVYADWLQEHGDEARAEFIRVQITLARMTTRGRDLVTLRNREWGLLGPHKKKWLGELVTVAPSQAWFFRRGFPDNVDVTQHPVGDAGIAKLVGSPHLTNLVALNIGEFQLTDAGMIAFRRAAKLPRLTTLDLSNNLIGDTGAEALATSPQLAKLTTLELWGNQIGDAGAEALAASTPLANLVTLGLGPNRISSRGWSALRKRFGDRVRKD